MRLQMITGIQRSLFKSVPILSKLHPFLTLYKQTEKQKKKNRNRRLFEGNETGRVGSTDTGTTVLDRLVCDRELSQVMANHLGLDFNLVELLTGVNTDNTSNHLRNDDHVTEVGLDEVGLLVGPSLLLGLTELLDQSHGLALKTTVEPSAGTSMHQVPKFLGCQVE